MQLELEELKKENERLRGLLEYSGSFGECSGVAASVTGRSTDIYFGFSPLMPDGIRALMLTCP